MSDKEPSATWSLDPSLAEAGAYVGCSRGKRASHPNALVEDLQSMRAPGIARPQVTRGNVQTLRPVAPQSRRWHLGRPGVAVPHFGSVKGLPEMPRAAAIRRIACPIT